MSNSSEEMSKKLAERLAKTDKAFGEVFKFVVQPEGPQGVRFDLVSNETGKYLQDNYNISNKVPIGEDLYNIIQSTGATGPQGPFFKPK